MSPRTVHILHLGSHWLRWAKLGWEGRRLGVQRTGEIMGEPAASLDAWYAEHGGEAGRSGEIQLYDSRPLYFNFALSLPRKARGQLDAVMRLKIRQELGLEEEAVCWTVAPEDDGHEGQLTYTAFVARRESLREVLEWKSRCQLTRLWVGADLSALEALVRSGRLTVPVLILNTGDAGVMFYFAEQRGAISRSWMKEDSCPDPSWWVGLRRGGWTRLHFGREDISQYLASCPAMAELPTVSLNGHLGASRMEWPAELMRFDPVILGGAERLAADHPEMPSLLREGPGRPLLDVLALRMDLRRWILMGIGLLLVLSLTVWGLMHQRTRARETLAARAESLQPAIDILRAREVILKKIRTDRTATAMQVFKGLMEASPGGGVVLQSLSLSASGAVRMQGTVQSPDMATQFSKGISEHAILEPESVRLQEVKQGEQNKISFVLSARVRGRGRR